MHIGILVAETLSPTVVRQFGGYGDMVIKLLSENSKSQNSTITFSQYSADQMQLPASIGECDAYVITGSRCSAFDDLPWIDDLQEFILKVYEGKTPCVGICFGHQLLAHTLGGRVAKSEKGWGVGVASFELLESMPWMKEFPKEFSLLVSHQDQVVQLPPGATQIAGNNFCPNEMFQLGSNILGMQAHPEFIPDYVRQLIIRRRESIGEPVSSRALESLSKAIDQNLVGCWILGFLQK